MVSPSHSLCHVFVFVAPGAPEAAALGLEESFRRTHPEQGTANLCFCFDNAYLELLWVEDPAALAGPTFARTRLAERSRWRTDGTSPFGVALRGESPLPFPTWDFRPPYLPEGMALPVATLSDDPRQPFLFRSPGNQRPDAWTDGRAGNRQHAAGLAEITGLHLDMPDPAPAWRDLSGLLTLGTAPAPRMVLTLSRTDGGPPRRLSLPDFAWIDTAP